MLKSQPQHNDNNELRNRPMTDIDELFAHKLPAETLVALDVAMACLFDNIKNIDPTLAKSIAIDLEQTVQQVPLHLPKKVHGASEVLNKWAAVLNSDPISQDTGSQN